MPNVIDQDVELENDPDWRAHRAAARDRAWARVPALRAAGAPLTFHTTGDKPDLLAAEVARGHARGYREVGIALRCPLDVCLARNRARVRRLDDGVVIATWEAFERFLADGTYARILDELTIRG
jgi:hypothetical protein